MNFLLLVKLAHIVSVLIKLKRYYNERMFKNVLIVALHVHVLIFKKQLKKRLGSYRPYSMLQKSQRFVTVFEIKVATLMLITSCTSANTNS